MSMGTMSITRMMIPMRTQTEHNENDGGEAQTENHENDEGTSQNEENEPDGVDV